MISPAPIYRARNFQKAILTGANFTGADLAGANLKRATITSTMLGTADLSGGTFADIVSGGLSGTPATLPTGWILIAGYLIGPQANLTGADLTGTNLMGANLFEANLTSATFPGAISRAPP